MLRWVVIYQFQARLLLRIIKTREVVREIPLERLFIETDSPYMSPEPHRGKRNNPSQVSFVADKIAQEKGISYEEVCRATKENAKKFLI